jgi:alpha-L-fucosidase 2
MKLLGRIGLLLCIACFAVAGARGANNALAAANDVAWTTLGHDENDSMPIGNGDLAANVWTEQNGDIVLLVAKADAWTELGKLVKLGRIRIRFTPNPFAGATDFAQVLRLEDGSIELRCSKGVADIWADANHPVIHVSWKFMQQTGVQAKLELWRTQTHPYDAQSPDKGGLFEFGTHAVPLDFTADTVLPAVANQIGWYHFNAASVYPLVLQQEHLEALLPKYPDPFLHRCFGAALTGDGFVAADDHTLRSDEARQGRIALVALTEAQVASPDAWRADLNALVKQVERVPLADAQAAHRKWWSDFWDRSWIQVSGTPDAAKISQGYAMQRYMMAASSRGAFPTKFNGGLFTVGHDLPVGAESTPTDHDPDFRKWGNNYWNQNNRLLYWPLIATGDFDLLKPWFDMYVNSLPLAEDRTQIYFHHAGASFIETEYFFGLTNINDFGWDNPTTEVQNRYMRYHVQGALEVAAQMLDLYDVTQDADFARKKLVPFADAIATYYDQQWPREANGRIRMAPVQSLETYQLTAVNPTPDIAGLMDLLPRLIALSPDLTTAAQRARWTKTLHDLPPIALGTTAGGKTPPLGKGDPGGRQVILPAEEYDKPSNSENPELYVAFPYRIYGVGKPGLDLARNTFAARRFPQDTCWGQDGTESAVLGLTDVAEKTAVDEFTNYGGQRFQWFWKAAHDWIPDLDNGGSGMITLQMMLMQTDGKRIQLLPSWPTDWTADFKLHAPYDTTVEGHVENGKITKLKVTPQSRAEDVLIVTPAN